MQQRFVGRTGLQVSRLALGTMSWGRGTDQHEATEQLSAYLDAGGTLVDSAAGGDAERVLGIVLSKVLGAQGARRRSRDDVVIASRVGATRVGGNLVVDTSRRALLAALDRTLQRLAVDHLDLWQLQAWGAPVPLAETVSACEHAVASGRVRYVGVAHHTGWQTAWTAAEFARVPAGPLASARSEYSLVARAAEAEVLPAAAALGLGFFPASPLGRGVLTGKYRSDAATRRPDAVDGERLFALADYLSPPRRAVVDAVCRAADGLGLTASEVALAWVRDRPGVTSPIVGARTAAQLRTSLAVERVSLPSEIIKALDEVSTTDRTEGVERIGT